MHRGAGKRNCCWAPLTVEPQECPMERERERAKVENVQNQSADFATLLETEF